MKVTQFESLSVRQQLTLLIAMQVRNAMEDFHVQHLSDAQMAELNPTIRQAIYDCLVLIEPAQDDPQHIERLTQFLIAGIPEYWEIPE